MLTTENYGIKENTINAYLKATQNQYGPNPYHNFNHATDVCASLIYFIQNSILVKHLSDLDNISIVIASFTHDVGHPGVNNRFLINNRENLALTYNDISVLENMHASVAFEKMKEPE